VGGFAVYGHVIQQPRIAQEAYGDFNNVSMDSRLAVIKPWRASGRTTTASRFHASMEPLFDSLAVDFAALQPVAPA
jgi:hypothetical protein